MKRCLLISNSTQHGSGYLDHCEGEIKDFLGGVEHILFVPFALDDVDNYARIARERYEKMGFSCTSIHQAPNPARAVKDAQSMFIGGGNTFRLLTRLYELGLLEGIRERVGEGMAYMGASAGSNMACPTIMTTNDMPIVYPPSFEALGLIPFQLNPHYLDPDPDSTHKGETRETRIREYHEMNEAPVFGLREGGILRLEGEKLTLKGIKPGRLFRRGEDPAEFEVGSDLSFLL